MLFKQSLILLLLSVFSEVVSQDKNGYKVFQREGYFFPYELNMPDKKWKLSKELIEISGLSYFDEHMIACVQDEKGKIYLFDTKKGEVVKKIDFADSGDYEGIEIVDNDAWILKSNGTLYQVKDFLKEKSPQVHKFKTVLTGKNNAEGLGYDISGNRLLIACKGFPFTGDKNDSDAREFKAIYQFNLTNRQLDENPVLLLALDSIKKYRNYNTLTLLGIDLLAFFDSAEGDVSFKPSAITVNPKTGNLLILASVGNMLAVISQSGQILALLNLKPNIHKQPEGICFSPDGTLYISNEGGDKNGVILKFNLNP